MNYAINIFSANPAKFVTFPISNQVEFANPQVQVPLTGARRQIQFPRPFGGRGGGQRGPNVPAGPETYQHYHR